MYVLAYGFELVAMVGMGAGTLLAFRSHTVFPFIFIIIYKTQSFCHGSQLLLSFFLSVCPFFG